MAKKMLTNFAKASIIDIWRGLECNFECHKSYKKAPEKAILEYGNFHSGKYCGY